MAVVGEGKLTLEGKVIRGDGQGGIREVEDLGVIASSDPADGVGTIDVGTVTVEEGGDD
jgi:hypothetical protein